MHGLHPSPHETRLTLLCTARTHSLRCRALFHCALRAQPRTNASAAICFVLVLIYSRVRANWLCIEHFRKGISMDASISTKELKSKLDRKEVTVVETLAPDRYREAHIPGALNIPPEQIKELAPQLLPNKNAEIVTYCANTH